MKTFDWTSFQVRIPITTSKSKLFSLWNSPAGLESWFLRKADSFDKDGRGKSKQDDFLPGDNYEWYWDGWGDEVAEKGTILENNRTDRLKFSFGNAGNVTIEILEEMGYNILSLTQDEIPADEKGKEYFHLGCKTGWTFHLANLKSIIEGGLDLRNKDIELKNVINS